LPKIPKLELLNKIKSLPTVSEKFVIKTMAYSFVPRTSHQAVVTVRLYPMTGFDRGIMASNLNKKHKLVQ